MLGRLPDKQATHGALLCQRIADELHAGLLMYLL